MGAHLTASKLMLKFCKPAFNSTWTVHLQMLKLDLEKSEEPEIKLPTSTGSSKKKDSSRKTPTFAYLTTPMPLPVWITTNCGKFFKRWEYQTTLPGFWEICMQVKKQVRTRHGTTDWFQIWKGVHQGCILSPCLFNLYTEYIVWNARLDEAQAGIKISRRNINNIRYADDITLMAESKEELKRLLMKVRKDSEKVGLKLNIQKTKIMASISISSVQFSSVTQLCLTICDPMNCSMPGLPVHHQPLESTQTHIRQVSGAIQPSHPLLSSSPPAPNPSQHQGLFQWVNSLHEVAKVLEFQLQHQSFQWTPRTDLP